jgi:Putative transposase
MNSLADLYPAAIGRQHPYGNLQPLPGLIDDRYRAISPLRLANDLNGGPTERVERIEDLNLSVFRAQGIVGVGVCILISTASFPLAASTQATLTGFILNIPSSSPSRSSAASSAGKFLDLLQRVPRPRRPDLSSTLMHTLLKHDWVVYAKPAFGGPTHVLRYLGRYTHRVAISNQRLLSFDGHSVSFRWKDYAHGNKQRIMALTATEFLRRFCQHVLPRGFVRIRHFGYLASAHRTALLALARLRLDGQPRPDPRITVSQVASWRCPRCGANMCIGSNLTAQQLAFRCKLSDTS